MPPPLVEIKPGHFVACHRPEKKMENGEYLFEVATEKRSERETRQTAQSDEVNKEHA